MRHFPGFEAEKRLEIKLGGKYRKHHRRVRHQWKLFRVAWRDRIPQTVIAFVEMKGVLVYLEAIMLCLRRLRHGRKVIGS